MRHYYHVEAFLGSDLGHGEFHKHLLDVLDTNFDYVEDLETEENR